MPIFFSCQTHPEDYQRILLTKIVNFFLCLIQCGILLLNFASSIITSRSGPSAQTDPPFLRMDKLVDYSAFEIYRFSDFPFFSQVSPAVYVSRRHSVGSLSHAIAATCLNATVTAVARNCGWTSRCNRSIMIDCISTWFHLSMFWSCILSLMYFFLLSLLWWIVLANFIVYCLCN